MKQGRHTFIKVRPHQRSTGLSHLPDAACMAHFRKGLSSHTLSPSPASSPLSLCLPLSLPLSSPLSPPLPSSLPPPHSSCLPQLLDLSPSFLDVLSKASRDEPNLGLTILVPPESALQDLLGDVTSSARRLDSFLFRHLVSEPLALSKMAALGRVQTAEAAALKVAPCDKCKAPGR